MEFSKPDQHPDQLSLCDRLERPLTNAERQRAYRARQKAKGRKTHTIPMTDREKEVVDYVLRNLRDFGIAPEMGRNKRGQMVPLDY